MHFDEWQMKSTKLRYKTAALSFKTYKRNESVHKPHFLSLCGQMGVPWERHSDLWKNVRDCTGYDDQPDQKRNDSLHDDLLGADRRPEGYESVLTFTGLKDHQFERERYIDCVLGPLQNYWDPSTVINPITDPRTGQIVPYDSDNDLS